MRAPHAQPPPPNPNAGAWQQSPSGAPWTWVPHGTPDPNTAAQWGYGTLTNPAISPAGDPNHGAWQQVPYGQGSWGWQWVWGSNPDPALAGYYGSGTLTNPDVDPQGRPQTSGADKVFSPPSKPPPDNVVPPTLGNNWGTMPDANGNQPWSPGGKIPGNPAGATPGSGMQQETPLTAPPDPSPYTVSPGGLRDAGTKLLQQLHIATDSYEAARGKIDGLIADAAVDPILQTFIVNNSHVALESHADAVELSSNLLDLLTKAYENYTRADQQSFLPG